jgi:hypothetical protein
VEWRQTQIAPLSEVDPRPITGSNQQAGFGHVIAAALAMMVIVNGFHFSLSYSSSHRQLDSIFLFDQLNPGIMSQVSPTLQLIQNAELIKQGAEAVSTLVRT